MSGYRTLSLLLALITKAPEDLLCTACLLYGVSDIFLARRRVDSLRAPSRLAFALIYLLL